MNIVYMTQESETNLQGNNTGVPIRAFANQVVVKQNNELQEETKRLSDNQRRVEPCLFGLS